MTVNKNVTFYLPANIRQRAQSGEHNFINKILSVLKNSDFKVGFDNNEKETLKNAAKRNEYSIFYNEKPTHDNCVSIQKNYFLPFWKIEKTNVTWKYPIVDERFSSPPIERKKINFFHKQWLSSLEKVKASTPLKRDFVLIALQDRLIKKRSFQYCSPIDMIRHTYEMETERDILITMDPKIKYDDEEIRELLKLVEGTPRMYLCHDPVEALIDKCTYVVTQNSNAAFFAFFHKKPAILFAESDFHHIAANVHSLGIKDAFSTGLTTYVDYEGYLWWFLQEQSINAGRPEAESKIASKFQELNWPIKSVVAAEA